MNVKGGNASTMVEAIKNYFREINSLLIEIDSNSNEIYRKISPYSYDVLGFCSDLLEETV